MGDDSRWITKRVCYFRPREYNLDMKMWIPRDDEDDKADAVRWEHAKGGIGIIARLSKRAGCRSFSVDVEYQNKEISPPGPWKPLGLFALNLHGQPDGPSRSWPTNRIDYPVREAMVWHPMDSFAVNLHLDYGHAGLPLIKGDHLETQRQARLLTAAHLSAFTREPHEFCEDQAWNGVVEPFRLKVVQTDGLTNSLAARAIETLRLLVQRRGAIQIQAAILEGSDIRGWIILTIPRQMN